MVAAGGVAAATRTEPSGRRPNTGAAVRERRGRARRRRRLSAATAARAHRLPAEGLRVLDLTRVLAGPVRAGRWRSGARTSCASTAPELPEIRLAAHRHGPGQAQRDLDARTATGAATLRRLAVDADVVLLGYRPGALDAAGSRPARQLLEDPDISSSSSCPPGAGAGRGPGGEGSTASCSPRAASPHRCRDAAASPGALPAQVLDHATGYWAAAAALGRAAPSVLTRAGRVSRLALAATAEHLRRAARLVGRCRCRSRLRRRALPDQRRRRRPGTAAVPARRPAARRAVPGPPLRCRRPELVTGQPRSHDGASTGIRGSGDATRPKRSVPPDQSW